MMTTRAPAASCGAQRQAKEQEYVDEEKGQDQGKEAESNRTVCARLAFASDHVLLPVWKYVS